MEEIISEISSVSSTISHRTKEVETKRPHFCVDESHPEAISSGNGICLEGAETVQSVQEMESPHERPRKKRHECNSSEIATVSLDEESLCKESCLGEDAYTQADGSSGVLREESLQTCEVEKAVAVDMECEIVPIQVEQKLITEVSCSLAGGLQQDSPARTTEMKTMASEKDFPKDGHPVNISKENSCGENTSGMNTVTNEASALVSAETSQSRASCQEEKTSEQKNAVASAKRRKKLLILDVNGLLADIVAYPARQYMPDAWISMKAVFKRPFCTDFLEFCFDNFEVGVWSSRNRKNVDIAVDLLLGDKKKKLLFCWDQGHCTDTGYATVEDRNKPLFLKEIKKLWDKEDPNLPWEKGYYNESNTVLMDDSPHKALRNPPYSGIFPYPYEYKDIRDNLLARRGKLRLYLERLAKADDVQKFIAENRFGQRPITKTNLSWAYYSKIFDGTGSSKVQPKDDNGVAESEASTSLLEPSAAKADDPNPIP